MKRRLYDPDHCTACGDFLPCGQSWIETTDDLPDVLAAHLEVPAETCWRSECRTGCYYIETCTEGKDWA